MKNIILFFSLFIIGFACSGDCIQCHPNLLKDGQLDKDHKILDNCINCHKVNEKDLAKMGSLCGQDCWDCHNVEKVSDVKLNGKQITEHLVLTDCIACHKKLDKFPVFLNTTKKEKSIFLK